MLETRPKFSGSSSLSQTIFGACKPDTCYLLPYLCGDVLYYLFGALPPIVWVLLGPARVRAVERVLRGGFGDYHSRLINGDGPHAAGPDVEPDQDAHTSLLLLARASLRRLEISAS